VWQAAPLQTILELIMKKVVVFIIALFFSTLFCQSFTSNATVEQNFCGRTVLVILDGNVSGVNRVHSRSLFADIDIVDFEDLSFIDGDVRNLRLNEETFRQILLLTLPLYSKENVLNVIDRLRFVEGIEFAEPNYILEVDDIRQSEIAPTRRTIGNRPYRQSEIATTGHEDMSTTRSGNFPNDPYFVDGSRGVWKR